MVMTRDVTGKVGARTLVFVVLVNYAEVGWSADVFLLGVDAVRCPDAGAPSRTVPSRPTKLIVVIFAFCRGALCWLRVTRC